MIGFCGQWARAGSVAAGLLAAAIGMAGAQAPKPAAARRAAEHDRQARWRCPASGTRAGGRNGRTCSRISIIRFLTETDIRRTLSGPDGTPAGFNVDLARMICEEIKVACTVQMRRSIRWLPR